MTFGDWSCPSIQHDPLEQKFLGNVPHLAYMHFKQSSVLAGPVPTRLSTWALIRLPSLTWLPGVPLMLGIMGHF